MLRKRNSFLALCDYNNPLFFLQMGIPKLYKWLQEDSPEKEKLKCGKKISVDELKGQVAAVDMSLYMNKGKWNGNVEALYSDQNPEG